MTIDDRTVDHAGIHNFKNAVKAWYASHRRDFPWREHITPYKVLVSEIMLQQTQTHRVIEKFNQFMHAFPDVYALAYAPQQRVLELWSGLGYNRRGIYLHKAAQAIVESYGGVVPDQPELLVELPGIGKATAASIAAFAYNKPTVFIETNIRAVFLHHFFPHHTDVTDAMIMPLIEQAVDVEFSREWYYALMDYGVMLKKTMGNACKRSAHHVVQSKFEGSDRQVRGAIVRLLLAHKQVELDDLQQNFGSVGEQRLYGIIAKLHKDGFLSRVDKTVYLI